MLLKKLLDEAQFHGSNRLTERHYRYWFVSLMLLMCAAAGIAFTTIIRYLQNPAFIVLYEKYKPYAKFPEVLMCPEVDFSDHKMDAFMATIEVPPRLNAAEIRANLRQLAAFYSPDVPYTTIELDKIQAVLDYNSLTVQEASLQLTSSCEETMAKCRLFGVDVNCSKIFIMALTAFGYCCVYNGRSLLSEISEHGVQNAAQPIPVFVEGIKVWNSLTVAINVSADRTDLDLSYKWVALERSLRYVEAGVNGTPIGPSMEYWIGHIAKDFLLGEDAKQINPDVLGCKLSTEKLQFFPIYTRAYCYVECEMMRTIRRCHCVKITRPRPHNVPYCRVNHLLCVKHATVQFGSSLCDCPPTCDKSEDMFVAQNYPLLQANYIIDPFYKDLDFSKISVVRTYSEQYSNKMHARRSYFTPTDLFAQIGGVFNVFFGCSILSILELIQIFSRSIHQSWLYRKQKKNAGLILPPVNEKSKRPKKRKKRKSKNKRHVKFLNKL